MSEQEGTITRGSHPTGDDETVIPSRVTSGPSLVSHTVPGSGVTRRDGVHNRVSDLTPDTYTLRVTAKDLREWNTGGTWGAPPKHREGKTSN